MHLLLLAAISATIVEFWPISRAATLIVVPYMVWVVIAATLSVGVAVLNGTRPGPAPMQHAGRAQDAWRYGLYSHGVREED